jgi:phosphotransferase system  glucose/maltose/N-acetylglucosamine-specific IIC component
MSIAYTISNKSTISSILFGALTTLLAIFDNKSFAELFFYKSYGGIIINGDNVITGIKDLVENGYSGELISNYLSGHYFLLFALVGIAVALSDEIKDKQKICLIVVTVATVLTGNISLLVLFLFFESWHLYLSVILLSALSFLASSLLDMKIGYMFNGGIIELILNINKPVYLFVGGLVFVAIGFFVAKYSHLKFGISDSLNIYIPSRLNNLVNSLGGIINIVKLNDDTIEIRNPKLVNNFELDCEIRENLVKLDSNKIGELKEYIK